MIKITVLRAAGLTEAQIVKVLEAEQSEELAARREQQRQASRRYRAKKAVGASVSAGVDASVGAYGMNGSAAPIDIARIRIPTTWRPNMNGLMLADQRGLSTKETETEIARFIDYYTSTGSTRVDWDAAFRCWLNSPYFERRTNGKAAFSQWAVAYAKLDAYVESRSNGAG